MLRKWFKLIPVILTMFTVLSACSNFTTEIGAQLSEQNIESGTRYSQILNSFGPPNHIYSSQNSFYFLYESVTMNESQFGINSDFISAVLFSAILASGHANIFSLLIEFDDNGYQIEIVRSSTEEDLGKGSGVQFLFAPMPLVDDSNLRITATQNKWGMTLLKDQDDKGERGTENRIMLLGSPQMSIPNQP